jgi:hypothetical protein
MFCTQFTSRIKALLNRYDSYLDNHIDTALSVTTGIKNFLSNPIVGDILQTLIPSGWESTMRDEVLQALSAAVSALTIADSCKQCTTLADQLSCFVTQLKIHTPDVQDTLLQKLASIITAVMDGHKLKQNVYDLYTQAKYTATKKA